MESASSYHDLTSKSMNEHTFSFIIAWSIGNPDHYCRLKKMGKLLKGSREPLDPAKVKERRSPIHHHRPL